MSDVFTFYMSIDEARHALSIVEPVHFYRLMEKHYEHAKTDIGVLFTAGADNEPASVIRGSFVREMAECERCYPALVAARLPRTEHHVDLLVAPEEVDIPIHTGKPAAAKTAKETPRGDG